MNETISEAAKNVILPSEWRRRRQRLDAILWFIGGSIWLCIFGVAVRILPDAFALSVIGALIGAGVIALGMYFGGAVVDDKNQKTALATVVDKLAARV